MREIFQKLTKWFNLGDYSICPECGGKMIQTPVADDCTECSYYVYYGGNSI